MMQSPTDCANSTGITRSAAASAAPRNDSKLRTHAGSTRAGDGTKTSHGSSARTACTPNAEIACSSERTRSASYSCHRYGPRSRGQWVTPASTGSRTASLTARSAGASSVDEEIDAAGHGDHLAGDVAGFRRGQKHDRVGD